MAECGCDKYKKCPYSDYKCCIDSFSRKEKTRLHYECMDNQPRILTKVWPGPKYYNNRCPCDEFLECERLPIIDEPVKRDGWSCCIKNDSLVAATLEELHQLCVSKPPALRGISCYLVN